MEEGKKETKKNFVTISNFVILIRSVLIFVFIYMLFLNLQKIGTLIIFLLAASTNFLSSILDNLLTKKFSIFKAQEAKINKRKQFLDKAFIVAVLLSLTLYFFLHNRLNTKLPLLILTASREILTSPAVLINIIKGKSPYRTNRIGKLTTVLQTVTMSALILQLQWAIYLAIPTGIIGLISAIDYFRYSFKK